MKIQFENLDEVISACIASAEHYEKFGAKSERRDKPYQYLIDYAVAFQSLANEAHILKRKIAENQSPG